MARPRQAKLPIVPMTAVWTCLVVRRFSFSEGRVWLLARCLKTSTWPCNTTHGWMSNCLFQSPLFQFRPMKRVPPQGFYMFRIYPIMECMRHAAITISFYFFSGDENAEGRSIGDHKVTLSKPRTNHSSTDFCSFFQKKLNKRPNVEAV